MRNQYSLRRINSRRRYESYDKDALNRKLDALCDELSDKYGANIASNEVVEEKGDLVAWLTIAELEGSTMDISVRLYGGEQYGFGYEAIFYLDDDYVSDYMPTYTFSTEEQALLNGVEDAMAEADKRNYWLDMDYSGYDDEDGDDYYDSEYESHRNRRSIKHRNESSLDSASISVLNSKLEGMLGTLSSRYGVKITSSKVEDFLGDMRVTLRFEYDGTEMELVLSTRERANGTFLCYEVAYSINNPEISIMSNPFVTVKDYEPRNAQYKTAENALVKSVTNAFELLYKNNFYLDDAHVQELLDQAVAMRRPVEYDYGSWYESRRKSSCRYEARMLKVRKTRPNGYRTMIIRDYNTYDVIGYVDLTNYGSVQVESDYKNDKRVLVIRDYNTYDVVAYVDISDLPSIQWEFS